MITHLPYTLVDRAMQVIDRREEHDARRNAIIRRGQMLVANLADIKGEQPDMEYETACWYVAQAQAVHQGSFDSEMQKRIYRCLRNEPKTLEYIATGVC